MTYQRWIDSEFAQEVGCPRKLTDAETGNPNAQHPYRLAFSTLDYQTGAMP